MNISVKSVLLVTIQLGAILAIFATGPLFASSPALLFLELLGGGVGLWALVAMRLTTFSVLPDVKRAGELTRRGPYRWIRHPMYLAVLLVTGALVLDQPTSLRMGIEVVLLIDILVKIGYEEALLLRHYPAYAAYRQATKRLLPYVY
ncbi:MAG: isoprenylcysteine carboxylmethyltransferase family protein [Caldilineaceae bacterium]|nr:isoprenylcysteine carboxylmethyltransferase family protein [Caldilineaceae bacterium]